MRISIPPYPYFNIENADEDVMKIAQVGVYFPEKEYIGQNIYLYDILYVNDMYYCTGTDGNIGVVISIGDIEESFRRIYEIIDGISCPNLQYRVDGGVDSLRRLKKLKEAKLIHGFD